MNTTPQDFGAIGDGIADDTVALQSWLDCDDDLYIPKGTYLYSDTLQLKSAKKISGRGYSSKLLCNPLTPKPAFLCKWVNPLDQLFLDLSRFSIVSTNNKVTDALIVDASGITSQHIYYSSIKSLYILGNTGFGINIYGGSNNGYFNSRVHFNSVQGGIQINPAGDSIVISENTVFGQNNGIAINPMTLGSSNVTITDNNITSDGYSIFIGNDAANIDIRNNQCEKINTGYTSSIVVCGTTTKKTNNVRIVGNNINGHAIASFALIYVNNANNTFIDNNVFNSTIGAVAYYLDAGTANTKIGTNNIMNGLSFTKIGG